MQVIFLEKFLKDLDKIKDRAVKKRIAQAIHKLEAATKVEDVPNLKKLTGFSTYYRLRVGDYRIGIIIDKEVIELARVAHRKDIYRLFP